MEESEDETQDRLLESRARREEGQLANSRVK